MDATRLDWLSATDAARAIADGAVSSEQLVEACLARIRDAEPEVQAWQFLDPAHALAQARAREQTGARAAPTGALHGVPVGIKDIIDTADMPTEDGTVLHAGRTPDADATVVAMLRAAGAVILGKTVTTECAYFHPGKTRNPHNPAHTPGRFLLRLGGRGRGRHGAARARQPDQRLGDPAGGVLRGLRLQADARPDPAPAAS